MGTDTTRLRTVVCELGAPNVPTEVLVCPWGLVPSVKGDFIMDGRAAQEIIAAFNQHGVDLVIDFEHQTLGGDYASPSGKAPAAGWIKRLFARPGVGLFASVSWTPEGAADLAGRKYRYLSPVVMVRKVDNRADVLHSVALTNKPAIEGMRAVVNRNDPTRKAVASTVNEYERLCEALRKALGLEPTADEAAILAAVASASGASANSAGRVDVTRFALRADLDAAVQRADTAENELLTMRAESFIREGQRVGKISQATAGHWLRAFSANPEQAREDLANEPVKFPPDGRFIKQGVTASGRGDRRAIINSAGAQWDGSKRLQGLTNRDDFINDGLRQAGLGRLTPEEANTLVR
jgi:hypothetical protein